MTWLSQISDKAAHLTSVLGIRAPVLCAPMWGVTTPQMVAAVSNAGGLGVLPSALLGGEALCEAIAEVKKLTDRPFAVDLRVPLRESESAVKTQQIFEALEPLRDELGAPHTMPSVPDFEEQFEAILASDVPAVRFSFGGPREVYAEALEARHIVMIGCVNSTREAKVLKTAGCQVIIAQGVEAGGPRQFFENPHEASQIGLMALLPPVVRVCGDVSVVASGAMMTAKSMMAAMMLGASGVEVGSLLVRTDESAWPKAMKDQVPWCDDAATRLTDMTNGRMTRVVPTGLAEALAGAGLAAAPYPGQLKALHTVYEAAQAQGRLDLMEMPLGQAAQTAPTGSAQAAVKRLIDEFEAMLGERYAD